jgi:hypothetical protein
MSEFLEWLTNEHTDAESGYEHALANEIASGYEIDASLDRKYCAGYLDALTNVLHQYAGPGDTN